MQFLSTYFTFDGLFHISCSSVFSLFSILESSIGDTKL